MFKLLNKNDGLSLINQAKLSFKRSLEDMEILASSPFMKQATSGRRRSDS
jgi:hypothetical protein